MKNSILQLNTAQISEQDTVALYSAINEAFFEYEEFTGEPYLRFASIEHFIQNLSDKDNHFLVVKQGDKFIGGISFNSTYPTPESETLYFGMLWVAPSARSQGLAASLIQMMEEEAKHRNKKGLMIRLFKIPKLVQYYKKLGFDFIDGDIKGPMVKYFS